MKKNHQQEKIPDDCPSILRELITDCWNDDPLKRPTAVELSYRLEKALEDLQKTKKEEVQPVSVIPLSMFQTPGVIQSEHVDNSPRPR